ncbi:MAG TPA: phosphopantothenoylcysteine decarboxylase [Turneriella sp.]|nr:phosphopantothenoylcysteine decarboxylase [Turneriella sp.]HMY10943.1 phosphopantothenoylcysteine decarboxylase [Turneriella sp.]HNE18209.1 phosphopantothenoylcysteine decarboxylase [Turneriella sp.]HNJ64942.1 phosphopantothenoylcysteine decarboxylase [Turneriella sp.]HNL11431.1 phosphopantothenoylcysteine decarboxylase [Turneriella sp.]
MRRRLVVTSGPTREFFDPIRFLSNPSTGRMGHSVAAAAVRRGIFDVVFISGPVMPEFATVEGARNVSVISTDDMLAAVGEALTPGGILVMAAAPADYKPAVKSPVKIKKTENPQISLVPNPDILKEMARRNTTLSPRALLIGFAAETHETEKYALGKLRDKQLDMIFLNDVSRQGAGFASTTNEFTVFYRDGRRLELANAVKEALGEKIIDCVLEYAEQQP